MDRRRHEGCHLAAVKPCSHLQLSAQIQTILPLGLLFLSPVHFGRQCLRVLDALVRSEQRVRRQTSGSTPRRIGRFLQRRQQAHSCTTSLLTGRMHLVSMARHAVIMAMHATGPYEI